MKKIPKYICFPNDKNGWKIYELLENNKYKLFKQINNEQNEIPNKYLPDTLISFGIIHTLWFIINSKNNDYEVIQGIINLQLEQENIQINNLNTDNFLYHKIAKTDKDDIYSVCVLDSNRPILPLKNTPLPDGCQISANLLPIDDNCGAIWQEFGQIVFALKGKNSISHAQVLGSKTLDMTAIQEIYLAYLSQNDKNIFINNSISNFKIWIPEDKYDFNDLEILSTKLNCELFVEPFPGPDLNEIKKDTFKLLTPPELQKRIKNSEYKKKLLIYTGTLLTLFMIYFLYLYLPIIKLKNKTNDLEKNISEYQENFNQLKNDLEFNTTFENAIKPETFVIEKFHQFSKLLPKSGVRFTSLKYDINKGVLISGEASTLPLALHIKNELKNSEIGNSFNWEFPQPTISQDGIAKFHATGK